MKPFYLLALHTPVCPPSGSEALTVPPGANISTKTEGSQSINTGARFGPKRMLAKH